MTNEIREDLNNLISKLFRKAIFDFLTNFDGDIEFKVSYSIGKINFVGDENEMKHLIDVYLNNISKNNI